MSDFVAFERMCCDLLASYAGFAGLSPQGVGRKDGGKDALLSSVTATDEGESRKSTVFHFSLRTDAIAKIKEDLEATSLLDFDVVAVVFVTNRRVNPLQQDSLKSYAKQNYGFVLQIYDREWLRLPLDGEFQRLRKVYLGIDYDNKTFSTLEIFLSNARRHPNLEDFKEGRFVHRSGIQVRLLHLLDVKRAALVVGRPGHGKTSIALAVGYQFLAQHPRNEVFYLSAKSNDSAVSWYDHITSEDRRGRLFIIDDCHAAVDAANDMAARLPGIRNAAVMFVSRAIHPELTGPADESFLDQLSKVRTYLRTDTEFVREIVRVVGRPSGESYVGDADAWSILTRTGGDLHLINYFVSAWRSSEPGKKLSDMTDDAILGDVYRRYLVRSHVQEAICSLCALSQFEIPAESRWFGRRSLVGVIKADAFVEASVLSPRGEPIETLRYFHSTPARFVLKAAHAKGLLGGVSVDRFIHDEIDRYIDHNPQNFFSIYGALDLHSPEFIPDFYGRSDLSGIATRQVAELPDVPADSTFRAMMSFALGLSRSGRADAGDEAHLFLEAVLTRYQGKLLHDILHGCTMATLALTMAAASVCSSLQETIRENLKLGQIADRAHESGVRVIALIIRRARAIGIASGDLQNFCLKIDRKKLREAATSYSFGAACDLLSEMERASCSSETVAFIANCFDFKRIAERDRTVNFNDILVFLRISKLIELQSQSANYVLKSIRLKRVRADVRKSKAEKITEFLELSLHIGVAPWLTAECTRSIDFAGLGARTKTPKAAKAFVNAATRAGFDHQSLHDFVSFSSIGADQKASLLSGLDTLTAQDFAT